jgi:hypothetical protein
MKAVIALAILALLSGCNKDSRVYSNYNFTITHISPNTWKKYYCDDFLITHSFVTFIDHHGVKRSISGSVDIEFFRNDLVRN